MAVVSLVYIMFIIVYLHHWKAEKGWSPSITHNDSKKENTKAWEPERNRLGCECLLGLWFLPEHSDTCGQLISRLVCSAFFPLACSVRTATTIREFFQEDDSNIRVPSSLWLSKPDHDRLRTRIHKIDHFDIASRLEAIAFRCSFQIFICKCRRSHSPGAMACFALKVEVEVTRSEVG